MQDANKNKSYPFPSKHTSDEVFGKLWLDLCVCITSTSEESGFMHPHVLPSLAKKKAASNPPSAL